MMMRRRSASEGSVRSFCGRSKQSPMRSWKTGRLPTACYVFLSSIAAHCGVAESCLCRRDDREAENRASERIQKRNRYSPMLLFENDICIACRQAIVESCHAVLAAVIRLFTANGRQPPAFACCRSEGVYLSVALLYYFFSFCSDSLIHVSLCDVVSR